MTPLLGITLLFLLFAGFGIAWAWFGPKEEAAQVGEAIRETVNGALTTAVGAVAHAVSDADSAVVDEVHTFYRPKWYATWYRDWHKW